MSVKLILPPQLIFKLDVFNLFNMISLVKSLLILLSSLLLLLLWSLFLLILISWLFLLLVSLLLLLLSLTSFYFILFTFPWNHLLSAYLKKDKKKSKIINTNYVLFFRTFFSNHSYIFQWFKNISHFTTARMYVFWLTDSRLSAQCEKEEGRKGRPRRHFSHPSCATYCNFNVR